MILLHGIANIIMAYDIKLEGALFVHRGAVATGGRGPHSGLHSSLFHLHCTHFMIHPSIHKKSIISLSWLIALSFVGAYGPNKNSRMMIMAKGETRQVRIVTWSSKFCVLLSFHFCVLQLLPHQEPKALEVHGKVLCAIYYYIIAWIQVFSIPVFLLDRHLVHLCLGLDGQEWITGKQRRHWSEFCASQLCPWHQWYESLYPSFGFFCLCIVTKKMIVLDLQCSFCAHPVLLVLNDRIFL